MSDSIFSIAGKVALITGGAAGIGLSIAKSYSNLGATVCLMDKDDSMFSDISSFFSKKRSQFSLFNLDICDSTKVSEATSEMVKKYGKIDILVNNAGIILPAPFIESNATDWQRMIDVNLIGMLRVTQSIGKIMAYQKNGKIINISSVHGEVGRYGHNSELSPKGAVVYAASKGAVSAFTKALAIEWAPLGINVNAIAPIITNTPMNRDIFQEERLGQFRRLIPLGRWLEPNDLVGSAVFLASSASDMITGHILAVDGGYLSVQLAEDISANES